MKPTFLVLALAVLAAGWEWMPTGGVFVLGLLLAVVYAYLFVAQDKLRTNPLQVFHRAGVCPQERKYHPAA